MICLETKLINPEVSGQDWLYLVQLFLSFSTKRANLDNWFSTANSETIGDRISIKAIFYKDFGGHLRKNHNADNYEDITPFLQQIFAEFCASLFIAHWVICQPLLRLKLSEDFALMLNRS